MSENNEKVYDASSISVLKGLEAVKVRPGMYIGNVNDGTGLHHMVFEVVDNSIDEALAGYCKNIVVTIHEDNSVSVKDDGRGIPTDIHPEEGVSAAEVILTVLHAGGKFDNDSYKVSGGLHGVGVSVVNALSYKLELTIHRNGKTYEQTYIEGIPQAPLKETGTSTRTGTTIRFWPNTNIFKEVHEFSYKILLHRLRELSFLNNGISIEIIDERTGEQQKFYNDGGLKTYVEYLNRGKGLVNPEPFIFEGEGIDNSDPNKEAVVQVEVALQWNDTYKENVQCFANNIPQAEGGTHLVGFRSALTRCINSYIEKEPAKFARLKKIKDFKIEGEDTREGLVAIVSVKLPNPSFSSQTKEKLVNGPVKGIVEACITNKLNTILEENPKISQLIIEKIANAATTRINARKVREANRASKKTMFTTNKLVHCNSRNAEECEVYLVEGDSAGGSAVKARDVQTQAILPLRGKILNVEKASFEKIISSDEITNIVAVLKTGINNEFNLNDLRYHKIVIMTDADVDGSHIRTLLLTFFYRQMPELIEKGHVYIAQPPLYKLTLDRKPVFLKNDEEYQKFLVNYALEGSSIEVAGVVHQEEGLKALCERYNRYIALINFHNRKYPVEVMTTLLNYQPLTVEDLADDSKMQNWTYGLLNLLDSTQDHSIRYSFETEIDPDTQEKTYVLHEIKHGLESTFKINQRFVESREYKEATELGNEIANIIPRVYDEVNDRFVIRGEKRYPIVYFSDVVKTLMDLAKDKLKPSRYKGLGEMNWEELEETTMKVENRTLLKVEIEDAIQADQIFSTLMGDEVEPRRQFIEQNALYVNNIDL